MTPIQGAGDRWLAGEPLDGVHFSLHDAVEIVGGPFDGMRGSIALLVGLTPEPGYLVVLTDRREVRVRQSALRRVSGA